MSADADRWARVQETLADALEMGPGEREVYLAEACAGDDALREEVESLLAASDDADDYFAGLADRAGITQEPDTGRDGEASAGLEGSRVGPYRLGALLGRDRLGAVYLAKRDDGRAEPTAALRILAAKAAGDESRRRFADERRTLARLDHPGIARLRDGGVTEDGTPWVVTEHVRGRPLGAWARDGTPDLETRLRLFLRVCEAVSWGHRQLVAHGDLEPSHVMVSDSGEPELLAFGIARLVEAGEAGPASPASTSPYAGPERLRGEAVTTGTDVYALGALLYELLAGAPPWDAGATDPELRRRILEEPPPPPSALVAARDAEGGGVDAARLRGDLDAIVLHALEKEPGRRYPSVDALSDDVRRHLGGFPVLARPQGARYVAARFVHRRRAGVAAAIVVALLLGALAAVATRSAVTTARQAERVALERDRAEAISAFLRELFAGANPALARGDTVTARTLLDRGTEEIRARRVADPDLAAEMMTVLGTAYHHLGLPEPALALLREARDLLESAERIPPERRAETMLRLGLALRDAGRADEAVPVLAGARDRLEALRGSGDRSVALAGLALGRALHASGDPAAARSELRQAVSAFRALDLEPDEEYAQALHLLAEDRQVSGETEGVEAMYRESLEVIESLHGASSENVPAILTGLAEVVTRDGRPEEGTGLLRRALAIDQRLYGSLEGGNHPSLAGSLFTLGRHLARYGSPAEAEALLRTAVRMYEESPQKRPDMHGTAILALAGHLREHATESEALALYERAASVFRDAFGPGSLLEAGARVDAADLLLESGRRVEAITALEAALKAYEGVLPSSHRRVQHARELLSRARGG
ncbi:MAG TPA: serine/threonine-protein kinase [Longimicrobiales bacterium]|nr:serine/threonine-protein kinase [Longimicrobiales bacterium]